MLSGDELLRLENNGIRVETADTPFAIQEAQALRHQVFCRERGVFPTARDSTHESDHFDERSRHIVVRDCEDDEVIATARVVAGCSETPTCLPMQRYCGPALFRHVDMDTVGEISRFAISKQSRRGVSASGPLIRLGLLRGILRVSQEMGLTHWCALMEPSLRRLLAATGVPFIPLGPMVECFGQREPVIAAIDLALAHGRRHKPEYYRLVRSNVVSVDDGPEREGASFGARTLPAWLPSASAAAASDAETRQRDAQHRERSWLRG